MSRILAVLTASTLLAGPAMAQQPTPEWVRPMLEQLPFQPPAMGQQLPYTGPRLGVVVLEMSESLRLHHGAPADAGVLVSEVDPDTAAEKIVKRCIDAVKAEPRVTVHLESTVEEVEGYIGNHILDNRDSSRCRHRGRCCRRRWWRGCAR